MLGWPEIYGYLFLSFRTELGNAKIHASLLDLLERVFWQKDTGRNYGGHSFISDVEYRASKNGYAFEERELLEILEIQLKAQLFGNSL